MTLVVNNIPVVINALYTVIKDWRGKKSWS